MDFATRVFAELDKLNKKIDRLNSMVQGIPTTHKTDLGDWLTEEQVQELLQRGATSIWGLRKTKKIKSKKIGNRNYYSKQSIIDYLDKQ